MTRKTYCGNLLWQSGLTLLASICKEHNRVLAKYHLEELGLPMGITDYELKKVLPTTAQLAKCVAYAERHVKTVSMGLERRQ